MVNTQQIAQTLGVKPGTVRGWRLKYGLPFYRIGNGRRGGTVLFNELEVQQWLEEFKGKKPSVLV